MQAYRLVYLTDVTAGSGITVSNTVKLLGESSGSSQAGQIYSVKEADASATMTRSGWIKITKQDNVGTLLTGVGFTLLSNDQTKVIRTGTTVNGVLVLRGLPVGSYWLKESGPLPDYVEFTKLYPVVVSESGGKIAVSVNGQTGVGSNLIQIINVKKGVQGNLSIAKALAGNASDATKEFAFTIAVDGVNGTYDYSGSGTKADGTITFEQGKAVIGLKGGESITIIGLPQGKAYQVTEQDYSAQKYHTVGNTGVILADQTQSAAFVNTRNVSSSGGTDIPKAAGGSLIISKNVSAGDHTRAFTFTVQLSSSGIFAYTGTGVEGGTIRSGDQIRLAHGQSILIAGLPAGTTYTVTEEELQDYTAMVTGNSGTIQEDMITTAAFVNTEKHTQPIVDPKQPPKPIETPTKPVVPGTVPGAQPAVPAVAITTPQMPRYTIQNVPSPASPNSPEVIVIVDESGVPRGVYYKEKQPNGIFVYVDEQGVPLAGADGEKAEDNAIPPTGDRAPAIPLLITLLLGIGTLLTLVFRTGNRKNG